MATLTPARIKYKQNGVDQTIRFHSVISEGHEATAEITKYPVQTGFEVSNHSIRKNRKVTIQAVISNYLLETSKTAYQYSASDESKTVFQLLKELVNLKIETEVTTNLGTYTPVVFTSFKTKQAAGSVDSMTVMLAGEELQVSSALNAVSPITVSWLPVAPEKVLTKVKELNAVGIVVKAGAIIEEVTVQLGESFAIENYTTAGQAILTTYEAKGIDLVKDAYKYIVHTTDTDLYQKAVDSVIPFIEDNIDRIKAGAKAVGGCLTTGATTLVVDDTLDRIDTAMGSLRRSLYGAHYDTMLMSKHDLGQSLIGMSTGCVVRGVSGFVDQFDFQPGESIPTATEIINGAVAYGQALVSGDTNNAGVETTETVLTKVTYPL